MLTFLHAADLHLDSPFQSLSPDQAAERRQEQRTLLARLANTVRESKADLLFLAGDRKMSSFGCFHGDLSSPTSRYGPVTAEQIAASGLDYLALGHSHTASGLQKAGKTWYAWPGCPEGRGFDETGDKGAYLGTLEDDGRLTLDFIPLAWRRYLVPALDITGRDPDRALDDLMAQANPQDILRIVLTGERDEDNEPDLTALTARASGYFYSASVVDRTVLGRSLWARMEEDTLTGLFLRNMRQRLDHAAPEDKEILERAIRFGLAALEGREEPK